MIHSTRNILLSVKIYPFDFVDCPVSVGLGPGAQLGNFERGAQVYL